MPRERKRKQLPNDFVSFDDFGLDIDFLCDDIDFEETVEYECEQDYDLELSPDSDNDMLDDGDLKSKTDNNENCSYKLPDPLEYTCDECSKKYKTVTGLRNHKKKVHKTIISNTNDTPCDGDTFADKTWLSISTIICLTLQTMINNPFFNMGTSVYGGKVVAMARSILEMLDKFSELSALLKERYQKEFSKVSTTTALIKGGVRENIFRGLDDVRCDRLFTDRIITIIKTVLNLTESDKQAIKMFVPCFLRQFSSELMQSIFNSHRKHSDEILEANLSTNDQNVLYLISGYILYALKRKAFRLKSCSQYRNILEVIKNFVKTNNTSSKTYVQKHADWTKKIDRGGLTYPADDFFLLIREMEMLMRKKIDYRKLKVNTLCKKNLMQEIISSFMVHFYWDGLCKECTDDFKTFLLEKIADIFLTVRGFAIARQVKAHFEMGNKPTKCEKSLRATLKEKAQNFQHL